MLESLDGPALRRWMRTAWRGLGRERAAIDELNVFPVADADTGTNLHLTVESVVATSGADDAAGPSEPGVALSVLARGALTGARGNSGVILAQYLRGLADGLGSGPAADGSDLARGLGSAADQARTAVAEPVEGTILTVADAAADAARTACVAGVDDLATVAGAAAAGARAALGRTPSQLAVLAESGVVDAGGRGLVVVLDALVATVVDADLPSLPAQRWPVPAAGERPAPGLARPARPAAEPGPGFEVMYTLSADDATAAGLRSRLTSIGDSVVVSGGDGIWAVHVHLDDAGAAVEAGIAAGQVSGVRVSALELVAPAGRAVVVVAPGEGVAALLSGAGATVVPAGAASATAAEVAAVVRCADVGEVVLLPSDAAMIPVAEAAARGLAGPGRRVAVVPTRAVVQSLAALAVHDPARPFDEDVVAMTSAAGATRYGSLAQAVREALTSVGRCRAGDVLGFVGDDVVAFGGDVVEVADDVVTRLLTAGGELVTLVSGAGAPPGLVERLREGLRARHPGVDVVSYDGGQPDHPLLVGVE